MTLITRLPSNHASNKLNTDPSDYQVIVDIYALETTDKVFEERYGYSFNGNHASNEDKLNRQNIFKEVKCEISSQDGDSKNITKNEAMSFLNMHRVAIIYSKDAEDQIPTMSGMWKYYRNEESNAQNSYALYSERTRIIEKRTDMMSECPEA